MKLTKTQLKRIIQEELQKVLQEQPVGDPSGSPTGGSPPIRGLWAPNTRSRANGAPQYNEETLLWYNNNEIKQDRRASWPELEKLRRKTQASHSNKLWKGPEVRLK